MKFVSVFILGVFWAMPAYADFVDEHVRLFKNQSLCMRNAEQVKAEVVFKEMFALFKHETEESGSSIVEIEDYSAYSTRLKNVVTGDDCSIVLHGGCYSAYCDGK